MAALLLTGCAAISPVSFPATHPASPNAPEGARPSWQTSLGPDELTRKSQAMLSAARKEQEFWDAHGPVSGSPEETPQPKPEGKHELH